MELAVTQEGSRVRLHVKGRIDEQGAEELKRRFTALPLDSVKEAIFDFSQVNHIGSAGLGKLLLFYKAVRTNGGTLTITSASEPIYDLLMDLELDKVFAISRA